ELGSVGAGDERLARARDDDGVDGSVPGRHHDPLLQTLAYPVAENVVGRVVDGNDGNAAATLEVNEPGHGCQGRLLCRRRLPVRPTMHSALALTSSTSFRRMPESSAALQPMVSYKSCQLGLLFSISSNFHTRFQFFKAFSRLMADSMVSCSSYHTN